MGELLEILIGIFFLVLFTFVPLGIWYGIGKYVQNKHYESIKEREARYMKIALVPSDFITPEQKVDALALVTGSAVIGSDPFKRYVASLVGFFGGRIAVFEPMLDRARREAILRMKETAAQLRADEIVNFRIETMAMCGGKKDKPMGIVEVVAYGTAVRYEKTQS